MKRYSNKVALLIEVTVDEEHPAGRQFKLMTEMDPAASMQACANVVQKLFSDENEKAQWAVMNVVAVSDI